MAPFSHHRVLRNGATPYLIQHTRILHLFRNRRALALTKRRKKVVVDPNHLLVSFHHHLLLLHVLHPKESKSLSLKVGCCFFCVFHLCFDFVLFDCCVCGCYSRNSTFLDFQMVIKVGFCLFYCCVIVSPYCSPFSIVFYYRTQPNDWLTCWWIVGFIATTCWCRSTTTSFSSMSSIHRSRNHYHSRLVVVSFVFFIFVLTLFYLIVVFVVVTHEIPLFLTS